MAERKKNEAEISTRTFPLESPSKKKVLGYRSYEDDTNLSDEDRKMSKISVFRDALFAAQKTLICAKHTSAS